MKIKHLLIATVAIVSLYLSACQKELNPDDIISRVDSTGNSAVEDSAYLDKMIIRDTNIVTGYIDSSKWVFNYDAQKRLSFVTEKSLSNPTFDSANILKFYYNTNDSLPYKIEVIASIIPTISIETYYYFYDNSGKLIKDSVNNFVGSGENLSRTLSYSGNKIFAELNSSNSTVNPIEKDTFTLDTRMNIVGFRYHIRTTANTFELASSSTSTFDNGVNPYVKVPSMKIYWFTYSTIDFEADNSSSIGVNNILTNIFNRYPYTGSSNPFYQNTYSQWNTYYQNGLLKSSKDSDHENLTYFYKSL
jgi:hypothetical protein